MCAFVVLGFVFFQTKPRDWRTSLKWPILCRVGCKTILCRVGRKTTTQSIKH